MDITKLSQTELKALAYDLISQLEQTQRNLKAVNDEIQKMVNEPKDIKPEPEPSEKEVD